MAVIKALFAFPWIVFGLSGIMVSLREQDEDIHTRILMTIMGGMMIYIGVIIWR